MTANSPLASLNEISRSLTVHGDVQTLLQAYCICDIPNTLSAQKERNTDRPYVHPELDSKKLEQNRVDPKILSMYRNVRDNKSNTINPRAEKIFMCSFGSCRKIFYKKWNFSLHMKMHYKIKQFKCQICSKEFTQKCNYNKHMKTHDSFK
ncbi:unnamed protein product [Moneuplotes crassus]|uniref:C2H2-type domain-containing protein n=1 Tax=Euplotes crassus TaxID=5936 RepID=A0AAD1Y7W6_EUPCR|nr:unnamed protein product [Moneuplotes crassus]